MTTTETVTRGGRARYAVRKLIALVRRDYEMLRAVTLPGPNAHRGFEFPTEIWLRGLEQLMERCKTTEARERLRALRYELPPEVQS